jgi:hypothetical protein
VKINWKESGRDTKKLYSNGLSLMVFQAIPWNKEREKETKWQLFVPQNEQTNACITYMLYFTILKQNAKKTQEIALPKS